MKPALSTAILLGLAASVAFPDIDRPQPRCTKSVSKKQRKKQPNIVAAKDRQKHSKPKRRSGFI